MKTAKLLAAVMCGVLVTPALGAELELTGTVRDVKRGDWSGGHRDFQTAGAMGLFAHVPGLVTMDLGPDQKPVYNPTRPAKDTIGSASSLASWFNDTPGVNVAAPLTLTLANTSSTPGIFTFSSNSFFPIDNLMLGNQGLAHNYHFTFELHTKFTYTPGQKFTFTGDDDVWVYINGKKVIDLGGVHPAITGSVLLFDGKAWVESSAFALSTVVKAVTRQQANALREKWTTLGLAGTCPIVEGSRYIDLVLENPDQATITCAWAQKAVTVRSTKDLSNVVLEFTDGVRQKFDNLSQGTSGTFAGTGGNTGKEIKGVWVKSGSNASGDGSGYGQYFTPAGGGGPTCTLDFFFAERHTTLSTFRIDTSMNLTSNSSVATSPLYD